MSLATNLRKAAELAAMVQVGDKSPSCNVYTWAIHFMVDPMELVRKASSWFRGVQPGSWVCIDQRGRICNSGKEFKRAELDQAFPVVVYLIDPEAGS